MTAALSILDPSTLQSEIAALFREHGICGRDCRCNNELGVAWRVRPQHNRRETMLVESQAGRALTSLISRAWSEELSRDHRSARSDLCSRLDPRIEDEVWRRVHHDLSSRNDPRPSTASNARSCLLVELKAVEVLHPFSKRSFLATCRVESRHLYAIGCEWRFLTSLMTKRPDEAVLKNGIFHMILPGAKSTDDNQLSLCGS